MTNLNLDALDWTPEELEQENARANRPTFRKLPVQFEGTWNGEVRQTKDVFDDGREFPAWGLPFTDTKFTDVGHGIGLYTDGSEYVLLLEPPDRTNASGKKTPRPLTQVGRTIEASGHELKYFAGSRVRVTEMARTYKNAQGYDRQSYYYKFEKIGDGAKANGASAPIPEEAQVAALTFVAGGQYTVESLKAAWMNSPNANLNPDLSSGIALGKWQREMVDAGRLKVGAEGILTA